MVRYLLASLASIILMPNNPASHSSPAREVRILLLKTSQKAIYCPITKSKAFSSGEYF